MLDGRSSLSALAEACINIATCRMSMYGLCAYNVDIHASPVALVYSVLLMSLSGLGQVQQWNGMTAPGDVIPC